jgi:hypothetical protein
LLEVLQYYLPATEFIAADMFWYWEEGHPESRVAPDVMVVKGARREHRRSFFTWREGGAVPCIVFEMASEHTWREDLGTKRRLYERLGVREYILFDPEAEYLRPSLQGFRLVDGRYESIEPDAEDRLRSQELGYLMAADGLLLRLFDGTTGARLLNGRERAEAAEFQAEQERLQAEQERNRADAFALEVERLKGLLEQARGGAPPTR